MICASWGRLRESQSQHCSGPQLLSLRSVQIPEASRCLGSRVRLFVWAQESCFYLLNSHRCSLAGKRKVKASRAKSKSAAASPDRTAVAGLSACTRFRTHGGRRRQWGFGGREPLASLPESSDVLCLWLLGCSRARDWFTRGAVAVGGWSHCSVMASVGDSCAHCQKSHFPWADPGCGGGQTGHGEWPVQRCWREGLYMSGP